MQAWVMSSVPNVDSPVLLHNDLGALMVMIMQAGGGERGQVTHNGGCLNEKLRTGPLKSSDIRAWGMHRAPSSDVLLTSPSCCWGGVNREAWRSNRTTQDWLLRGTCCGGTAHSEEAGVGVLHPQDQGCSTPLQTGGLEPDASTKWKWVAPAERQWRRLAGRD
ncbi:hypothetical protein NDU88_008090 [Pleurodeles waltl]|uniref:Uncharacterized protein n=1 Tax=Pleurodeles waltl TaxID=8319 RepID=A0AAV7PS55_PLEWA|nr:hypothetical protein NDU88_008090 [Pleurodeles waltl]